MQATNTVCTPVPQQNITIIRVDTKRVTFAGIHWRLAEGQLKAMSEVVLAVVVIRLFLGRCGAGETTERWVFFRQLKRWKLFRQFQQRNRHCFVFHNNFPEFQQRVLERRRRHGLDGHVQLLEVHDKQSKLNDWIEYQDYELRTYERLEKAFKEAQERLASRRKALAEAGISAFEGIEELEFAKKRLKAAGSDDLGGENVERATWGRLFLKEVEIAKIRMDELQRLAEDATRELEPYKKWFYGRRIEWGNKEFEDPEEGGRMIQLECESTERQDRMKKLKELRMKNHEAGMAHFRAKREVEFAEEAYDAARLDNLGETVERAAFIKMALGEVRSAQIQVEEAKEPLKKIQLKGAVISALGSIPLTRGKVKRYKILLELIEQQRQEIAGGCTDIKKEGGRDQLKEVSSRVFRNHPTVEALRVNKIPRASGRKRKQSTARSILSPVVPTKISKAPSKRRSFRRKLSVLCESPQAAEKMTIGPTVPQSESKQALKIKDTIPAPLRSIHSSRVRKPGGKRLSGLQRGSTISSPTVGTPRQTRETNLGSLTTRSTGKKAMQQSAEASLRRSTRTSKRPERFCPGYT
ncbi:MAG: hypothetical protein Q9185_005201 [Variospora sp. 1 TL-2023]